MDSALGAAANDPAARARQVVVVGGGIVGVACAIWLRRAGCEVTLVDRDAPGQATSFGNGGVLAACAMVPVTGPGLLAKVPGMLLDRDAPLYLRWSYLPRLMPWLLRYMSHATDSETRRIAEALAPLVADSPEQHLALTEGLSARTYLSLSDYAYAYADRAAYEADSYAWGIRRAHGFVPDLVEGDAVRDYEPAFGPDIGCVAALKDHGHVLDPGGYVAMLARDFAALGGRLVRAGVEDMRIEGGRVRAVLTDAGALPCDHAVLAAGVWSDRLTARLGLKVPMETERGYHVVFEDSTGGPSRPVMVAAGKFVATPMAQGLRCAGVLEFGGLDAGRSRAPLALLRRQAKRVFPRLAARQESEWMGHRPAPSDSLPLIGEIGSTGIVAAFGHHHIGLTAGPKTGRLVAQMVAGQSPNIDTTPYQPGRFAH